MRRFSMLLAAFWYVLHSQTALGIFSQTSRDLQVLEDDLRRKLENDDRFLPSVTPMLVARPKHLWRESRLDFEAAVLDTLRTVFSDTGSLIDCPGCDTHRLYAQKDQRLIIKNGELGASDFALLREKGLYKDAKSMAFVTETPSGVEMRVISLKDGRILYLALADSSRPIDQVNPYLNYSQELERRKMGEALAYVFVNLGVYPEGLFQLEWVEQFGARNQHIAGIGVSLFNPLLSIGGVYHYMIPGHTRANVAGAVYYPLQNALGEATQDEADAETGGMVVQVMGQYAFTDTFGTFLSINTRGTLSLGVNMFNPLLLPFML